MEEIDGRNSPRTPEKMEEKTEETGKKRIFKKKSQNPTQNLKEYLRKSDHFTSN